MCGLINTSPCVQVWQLQNGEMIFFLLFLLHVDLSSTGWVAELLTCIFSLQPCCSWGPFVRNQVLLNPFCMLCGSVWCPWKSVSRFFACHILWPAWIPTFYTFVHGARFLRLTFLLVWLSFNQQCISTLARELKAWLCLLLLHYTVGIPVGWATFHNWWWALRKIL